MSPLDQATLDIVHRVGGITIGQATLDIVHRVGGITIGEAAYQLARVGQAPTHRALSDTLARLERGGHITSDVHPNGVTAWQGVEA